MGVLADRTGVEAALERSAAGRRPTPIVLQETAAVSVRRHAFKHIRRMAVLVCTDALTLLALREIVHAARDAAALGTGTARVLEYLVPRGTVQGPQLFAALVLTLMVLGMYGTGDKRRPGPRIVLASFVALGPIFWNNLWTSLSPWVFESYLASATVAAAVLITERSVVDWAVRVARRLMGSRDRTLVVGPAEAARKAAGYGAVNRELGLEVVGFVDADEAPAADALGGPAELVGVINDRRIDTIILSGDLDGETFRSVLDIGIHAGCRILSVPRNTSNGLIVPEMVTYRGVPLIQLTNPGLQGDQLAIKRMLDLVVGTIGLVVLSPLFLVIAAAIRLESPGPVFFTQMRVGEGGRRFRMFKFRSMAARADGLKGGLRDDSVYGDPRLFKMARDPRVTRLGRFLRRSSLDELPQLINVVRGEMSLVGPRPPIPEEVALYEEHHYARFAMKPGMTGPWQVGGRNRVTDFDEVILLEQGYMRGWNIWKDLAILARTVPSVLRMEGAY